MMPMDDTRANQVTGVHPNVLAEYQLQALAKIERHVQVIKGWVIFFGIMFLLGAVLPALVFLRAS